MAILDAQGILEQALKDQQLQQQCTGRLLEQQQQRQHHPLLHTLVAYGPGLATGYVGKLGHPQEVGARGRQFM